jgi:hypothetical protein
MTEFYDNLNSKYYSTNIHIDDINKPLVISYENNMENITNSQIFKKTLEKCEWEYMFIGEGVKWVSFRERVISYYNCLQKFK